MTEFTKEDIKQLQQDILDCARYGEYEDLEMLIKLDDADVNYNENFGGNTPLHCAAANGEIKCMKLLLENGAKMLPNESGNLPLHWAVQNGKIDAVKLLIENYECDMLIKNKRGLSVVSEAFNADNADILEIILSHDSATEDRLLPEKLQEVKPDTEDNNNLDDNSNQSKKEGEEENGKDGDGAVTHYMQFISYLKEKMALQIRELPITTPDNPFGGITNPEDDSTGLAIWPASIILSHWIANEHEKLKNKVVIELGAGAGLPSFVAARCAEPSRVYLTDIHEPALDNARYNLKINSHSSNDSMIQTAIGLDNNDIKLIPMSIMNVNWINFDSFPEEQAEILIGSDLVYDENVLSFLIPAVDKLLASNGSFWYVAPITGRAGMAGLKNALSTIGISCHREYSCPEAYYHNPLVGENASMDDAILHFYDLIAKKEHTCYEFKRI